MVCLVWFYVAALLLLLHTSTQTDYEVEYLEDGNAKIFNDDVELKNPKDVKKQISLNEDWKNLVVNILTTSNSEIQSLRDTIVKADPNGTKNIDESAQDLRGNYEKQFPNVTFDSSSLEASLKENAELSENMTSQYSLRNCNTLIPYHTADVRLMDVHIDMKFEFFKELYIVFFKEDFLSKILKVMSNDGN